MWFILPLQAACEYMLNTSDVMVAMSKAVGQWMLIVYVVHVVMIL